MMDWLWYFIAPPLAIFMDKMYFLSEIGIIHGYFPVKRKYTYSDFTNYRLFFTVISALIISYSGINKDILFGMIGAVIFSISHFWIYVDIYRRERKQK